jgi:glycerophosphoryl diester phosphodiesterase
MSESRRPLLLGHRGARAVKSILENTIESFDRALSDGCDGFEFDVRLTADAKAVICHDPRCGGLEIERATAAELGPMAQLDQVLRRYQSCAFLDIELKVPGLEVLVAEMLRTCPPQRGFVISSFLPEVLRVLRHRDSALPLGLICETRSELQRWDDLPVSFVIPHFRLVDAELVAELKSSKKEILVWTVNHPKDMRRFCDLKVDGIISDDAKLLSRTLL